MGVVCCEYFICNAGALNRINSCNVIESYRKSAAIWKPESDVVRRNEICEVKRNNRIKQRRYNGAIGPAKL